MKKRDLSNLYSSGVLFNEELEEDQIEPAPTLGTNYKAEFITGMARANDDFVMLLNMSRIFSLDEINLLQTETTEAQAE